MLNVQLSTNRSLQNIRRFAIWSEAFSSHGGRRISGTVRATVVSAVVTVAVVPAYKVSGNTDAVARVGLTERKKRDASERISSRGIT